MTIGETDVLDAFRESDDPVLTTAEVAETTATPHRNAEARLDELATMGIVERKRADDGSAVWWLPGETATNEAGASDPHEAKGQKREDGLPQSVETAIEGLALPEGCPEARRAELYDTCLLLHETGSATGDELREHALGGRTGETDGTPETNGTDETNEADRNRDGDDSDRWQACLRPALDSLSCVSRTGDEFRLDV